MRAVASAWRPSEGGQSGRLFPSVIAGRSSSELSQREEKTPPAERGAGLSRSSDRPTSCLPPTPPRAQMCRPGLRQGLPWDPRRNRRVSMSHFPASAEAGSAPPPPGRPALRPHCLLRRKQLHAWSSLGSGSVANAGVHFPTSGQGAEGRGCLGGSRFGVDGKAAQE